jgi:hypothetical protein
MCNSNNVAQPPRPRSPFQTWPVQLHDPRFGFAWYTAPAIFIAHIDVTHGSVEATMGLNDALDRVIATRDDEIRAAGGLLVIQDFRTVKSYSSEARQSFVERLKRRPRGYSRGVYVAVGINPLLRMAVQTVNIAFSMVIGGTVELIADPTVILRRLGIQSPARGLTFP